MYVSLFLQHICGCITPHTLWLAPPQRTSHGIINNGRVRLVSLSVCGDGHRQSKSESDPISAPTPALLHTPLPYDPPSAKQFQMRLNAILLTQRQMIPKLDTTTTTMMLQTELRVC